MKIISIARFTGKKAEVKGLSFEFDRSVIESKFFTHLAT